MGSAGALTILVGWFITGGLAFSGLIWALAGEHKKHVRIILILISLSLPFGYYFRMESKKHSGQSEYFGEYRLKQFPNCQKCIMELKEDNSYVVMDGNKVIRKGEWEYVHFGDYWAVEIDEHGRLGSGDYEYFEEGESP